MAHRDIWLQREAMSDLRATDGVIGRRVVDS